MTLTIGAYEAKTHLGELLERAYRGEEIIITKRGKPMARLNAPHLRTAEERKNLLGKIKESRKKATIGPYTWRELTDDGRKW